MAILRAKLTISGLYNYDNTIFDLMQLPPELSKPELVQMIIHDLSDFPVIYPDAAEFKQWMGDWSVTQLPVWQRIVNTLLESYDPLHNYDRTETVTETTAGNSAFSGTTKGSGSDTVTDERAGYNSSSYVPADKSTTTLGSQNDSNSATASSGSRDVSTRTYGNIGVTMATQMAEAEISFRLTHNMYQIITKAVRDEFCVPVY